LFLAILSILSRTGVPWFLKLMISLSSQVKINRGAKAVHIFSPSNCIEFISSRTFFAVIVMFWLLCISQTNELYQLAAIAFCLLFAWFSDKLGLSLELGSFAAGVMISTTDLGVMISTTDLAQHTLEQIERIRNFFAAFPSQHWDAN